MTKQVLTTARSMKMMRAEGWSNVGSVEKWVPGANVRRDLFGFIDLIALHPRIPAVVGVQCYTESTRAAHLRKIAALDKATGAITAWLEAGGGLILHEWRKRTLAPNAKTRKKGTASRMKWECLSMAVGKPDNVGVTIYMPSGPVLLNSFLNGEKDA